MLRGFLVITTVIAVAGCETYGGTGSSRNSVISVQYGVVESIERAAVDANVAQGAAVLAPSTIRVLAVGSPIGIHASEDKEVQGSEDL